jgi:inner membrane protein
VATPIGHALAGYAVGRFGAAAGGPADPVFLLACVALALAPDLDFVPGILQGVPPLYHQGITHSLSVAAAVSLATALALGRVTLRAWGLLFGAYVSHLLIDLFGPDARAPYGIPLFWPLDDAHHLSSLKLFLGVHHATSTFTPTDRWLATLADLRNLTAVGVEIALLAPCALLARAFYRRRQRSQAQNVGSSPD